jgi:hypothetical protein
VQQRHAVEGRLQRAAQGVGGRSDNDHQIRGGVSRGGAGVSATSAGSGRARGASHGRGAGSGRGQSRGRGNNRGKR